MDIVRFKGGLGNQMFQYAFYRALQCRERDVRASLEFYKRNPNAMRFCLTEAFPEIGLNQISDAVYKSVEAEWEIVKKDEEHLECFRKDYENRFFWVEEGLNYQPQVFATRNCTFVGFWQSEKYFKNIRGVLLRELCFAYGEEKLSLYKKQFLGGAYAAIHIRRGDYLKNPDIWGNLSESAYYREAIHYMKSKLGSVHLVFFSDDIPWVRQNYWYEGAVYVDETMFEHYEAWYDMCLMSCCSYHIIANSTFSWWGAWLSANKGKLVIAPDKWFFDGEDNSDIYPEEWIRLKVR